jgi:ribonuclease P protein component
VKNTIKSTDEISSLFKTAQKITTDNLIVLVKQADGERGPQGRVAFIAGKRLGSAPRRNRAKRLMREAARAVDAPWPGVDVAFIARERTVLAALDMLVEDMKRVRGRFVGATAHRPDSQRTERRAEQRTGQGFEGRPKQGSVGKKG